MIYTIKSLYFQRRLSGLLFSFVPLEFFMYACFLSNLHLLFLCLISFLLFPCSSVSENTRA